MRYKAKFISPRKLFKFYKKVSKKTILKNRMDKKLIKMAKGEGMIP